MLKNIFSFTMSSSFVHHFIFLVFVAILGAVIEAVPLNDPTQHKHLGESWTDYADPDNDSDVHYLFKVGIHFEH